MACTPSDAASTDAWSRASPFTHSHPDEPDAEPFVLENARIFHPCRENARAVSLPIPPFAPTTRTIRDALDISILLSTLSMIDNNLSLIDYQLQDKIWDSTYRNIGFKAVVSAPT